MIRRWCLRRWHRGVSDGEWLLRSLRIAEIDSWADRFDNWHVARYGETNRGPLWIRPFCRFEAWYQDWRFALCHRKPLDR